MPAVSALVYDVPSRALSTHLTSLNVRSCLECFVTLSDNRIAHAV